MASPAVGIVTTWFERGAAYVSRAYRDALAAEREVHIYARGGERYAIGDPQWDGPRVRWSGRGQQIDRADFTRWVRQNRIGVVLFNEQVWWPPVLWAHDLGLSTVAYVDYYTARTVPWFAAYDAVWCNTRRHHSVFAWHHNAAFIPWGTDLDLFAPRPRPPHEEVVFFHSAGMGGVNTRKGTDLLVAAFRLVRGPARLVIHSQVPVTRYGEVGPMLAADPRIEFVEATVPAPGLYHLGDVYVYPTRLDGIGLTVAEALASGLPVIATDIAPCNEFVVPDVNGWLVPVASTRPRSDGYYWPETECDVPALAAAMQACVDEPRMLTDRQRRAREYARTHLDWRQNSAGAVDAITSIETGPQADIPPAVRSAIERAYRADLYWPWRAAKLAQPFRRCWRGTVRPLLRGLRTHCCQGRTQ